MSVKRRRHSPDFKFRVALTASGEGENHISAQWEAQVTGYSGVRII